MDLRAQGGAGGWRVPCHRERAATTHTARQANPSRAAPRLGASTQARPGEGSYTCAAHDTRLVWITAPRRSPTAWAHHVCSVAGAQGPLLRPTAMREPAICRSAHLGAASRPGWVVVIWVWTGWPRGGCGGAWDCAGRASGCWCAGGSRRQSFDPCARTAELNAARAAHAARGRRREQRRLDSPRSVRLCKQLGPLAAPPRKHATGQLRFWRIARCACAGERWQTIRHSPRIPRQRAPQTTQSAPFPSVQPTSFVSVRHPP